MSRAASHFDHWLRNGFTQTNTELEERYFESGAVLVRDPETLSLHNQLVAEGSALAADVLAEQLPASDDERYQLLGAVGYFMAACRRHETPAALANPSGLTAASELSELLGRALGVAPRFVSAHQSSYNLAIDGRYRTFTTLDAEYTFLTLNGRGTLAYRRAARALSAVPPMGMSNPLTTYVLQDALDALKDVLALNTQLDSELDVNRFFLNVRPYYKTYRVGSTEYRGANAGDFCAINELDLLLGLARADDPFYRGILEEKQPFLAPADQRQITTTLLQRSLLDDLLLGIEAPRPADSLLTNARLFLEVCTAHGAAYAYHHHRLVDRYLSRPAASGTYGELAGETASGPPLDDVVAQLSRIADIRAARDRPGLPTAASALRRIESRLEEVDSSPPRTRD